MSGLGMQPAETTASPVLDGGGAEAAEPLRIGEVISLTGAVSSFGVSAHHGVQLAAEETNEAGGVRGHTLEVRSLDGRGSVEGATLAMTRLIVEDGVRLILGEVESTNSIAMAKLAQERRIPMVSPASTNPKVTDGRDYVFRVCFVDAFQGFVMAKFGREHLKLQRVAVLKDPMSDYSTGLADVFTRKFTEMGGKVVAQENYARGDQDFRAQLRRILAAHPEALYVPGYYSEVAAIVIQAKELGLSIPLMGADGWDSEKLYELAGPALEGHYFSNHYSAEDPSPRSQRFIAAYKRKFGAVPDSLAALGYDAARVAIEALKRAKTLEGPSIRDAIAQTKDFPGVTGNITLDQNRNAVKPAVVVQIQEGHPKYVTTVAP